MTTHLKMKPIALAALLAFGVPSAAYAEGLTLLFVGDQESWLLSAQGNLRDDPSQSISFYGGVDRMATVLLGAEADAKAAGNSVLKLNAGDAILPGVRLNASFANLGTAYNGGQDFYDAMAMRHIGFDATVFGNHEFDLGAGTAARFAEVSGTKYLSSNLDFGATSAFASLALQGVVAPSMLTTTAGGLKVGIVGLTTPLLPKVSSPGPVSVLGNIAGASDLQNLEASAARVQAQVDALRSAGAGTVIMLSHLQNANNELNVVVPKLKGVDVVISGGGHELMADLDDVLLPNDSRAFTGMPQFAVDADGKQVAVVTGNFGNRYVGELSLTLDDATGALASVDGSRMLRVSGTGADAVTPDAYLNSNVVAPVKSFVDGLNAQVIGTSAVVLNGERGTPGTPGSFVAGVRNSETNLGNLMADALRFAGGTDVALQNGGGIRASIGAGNVTVGDTFNVAPFTNLVKTAQNVDANQLKQILEHAYGGNNTNASGGTEGRYAQISGMRVVYDSGADAGSRILKVTLDDGTVLIDGGLVIDSQRKLSIATIDFLANGGDGYPYAGAGVLFDNATNSITYQEALLNYIVDGLGGEIAADKYGVATPFDTAGRLVDHAVTPVPEPETWAMLLAGLGLVGLQLRKKQPTRKTLEKLENA